MAWSTDFQSHVWMHPGSSETLLQEVKGGPWREENNEMEMNNREKYEMLELWEIIVSKPAVRQ